MTGDFGAKEVVGKAHAVSDERASDIRAVARLASGVGGNGTPTWLARVVAWRGFGGRRQGEALLYGKDGAISGGLLGGLAEAELHDLTSGRQDPPPVHLFDLAVGDSEAVGAGLACGGMATVLASELGAMPPAALESLRAGRPVAIVTSPWTGARAGGVFVLTQETGSGQLVRQGSLGDADLDDEAEAVGRSALREGRDVSEVHLEGDRTLVVEAYLPTTMLVVVGEGALTAALRAQGGLLSWQVEIVDAFGEREGELVTGLGPTDAVVVLSHDRQVDIPALAAALRAGCYVGALGSRHTQAARRERLEGLGFDESSLARIHGPVGLDLGTRTPEETALAIAAEILAHRAGRGAVSLRDTTGPVNG